MRLGAPHLDLSFFSILPRITPSVSLLCCAAAVAHSLLVVILSRYFPLFASGSRSGVFRSLPFIRRTPRPFLFALVAGTTAVSYPTYIPVNCLARLINSLCGLSPLLFRPGLFTCEWAHGYCGISGEFNLQYIWR